MSGGLRLAAAVACGAATIFLAASLARQAPRVVAITLIVAVLAGTAAAVYGRRWAPSGQVHGHDQRPVPAAVGSGKVPLALTTGEFVRLPLMPVGQSLAPTGDVPDSVAELVRAVRDMAPPVRLIQVTSPLSGEGKTTIAANLAAALAGDGRRVLLIDAHHARHRAHLLLGATPETAISGLAIENYVLRTRFDDVDLLRVSEAEGNGTPPLEAVTWDLLRGYDWTVLDTAGGMSRPLPEAVVRADLNLLVVRADHTSSQLIDIARRRLNWDPMIVVVNADPGRLSRTARRASAKLVEP